MFLFLEIGNTLTAVVYAAAQRFQTGAFKFRLEESFPCSNKGHVPYCEWGDLKTEAEWQRQPTSLHIEYAETGLEVVAPSKFNLFFICEAGKLIGQRAFDEVYDKLVEILQKKKDEREPPNMAVACINLLPEEYRHHPTAHIVCGCFVGGAASLDREE